MLKIFCWWFFDAFQRYFISDQKRFRTKLKCSKVLFEIMSFYPKPILIPLLIQIQPILLTYSLLPADSAASDYDTTTASTN